MGKPNIRLNPQIDSIRSRVLLNKGTELLLSAAMLLPKAVEQIGKGRRRYDYRIVLVLCILRILLKKKYSDYETEMRTDKRLIEMLGIENLPCKSTINNYMLNCFNMKLLSRFNMSLIMSHIKKPIDLLLDAFGIQLVGRSIWYCIRVQKKIRKKDCDKVHIAVSLCSLLIANFRITNSRRNDSPFLRKLLKPFKILGLVIADRGYSGKINAEFVRSKNGSFFCPFKENARPTGLNYWAYLYRLWNLFPSLCKGIYAQRNLVEAVFSALKIRSGDELYFKVGFNTQQLCCGNLSQLGNVDNPLKFISNLELLSGLSSVLNDGLCHH